MFGLIKKIFIVLLSNMTQPILINLHPNKYSQEFHYYPFAVKLGRCVESWNTLNGLYNKVCVPNKTEDLNLNVFNMIKGINESKIYQSIYHANVNVNLMGENVIQINGGITMNINMSIKNVRYVKKIIFM